MLLILFLALVALSIVVDTIRWGISPMPTSRKARKVMVSLVEKGEVYELGSGWGSLAIELSKKNSVRAFEKALIPWIFSIGLKKMWRGRLLSIEKRDFFIEDLSKADIVICYLYPGAMKKLGPKFERELKNGALVISNSFQIPGRKPDRITEVGDWMGSRIYSYRFINNR